ncbi:MAG: ATP synthase F1 subunit epsilon [Patescibacteria group bacterium]
MLHLKLISAEKTLYDHEIYEVLLPTANGQIAILPNHQPLIAEIIPGIIIVRSQKNTRENDQDYLATSGGIVEVKNNTVRILCDSATRSEDLNELEIQKAHDRALHMKKEAKDNISLADASAELSRSLAELKLLEMLKKSRR